MLIYKETDYRIALKNLMAELKRRHGLRFTFEGMANAAGVQKSYLSRVMAGKGHLSDDQLFLASNYLRLEESQYDYLAMLLAYQRSSSQERRKVLQRRIDEICQAQERTECHIKTHSESDLSRFFSHPFAELVHAGLTISRYQRQPHHLRQCLNLSPQAWAETLSLLDQLGLVARRGGSLCAQELNHHLPTDHPVRRGHTLKKRVDALRAFSEGRDPKEYRFSAVFSAAVQTRSLIKEKLLAALAEIHEHAVASEAEDVYQLDIDFFSWTGK